MQRPTHGLRYILFHHQTTTILLQTARPRALRYILFHHQTTTPCTMIRATCLLRYILFHHQTTTRVCANCTLVCCVISSFITKPQHRWRRQLRRTCCVISSFITKPQPASAALSVAGVALYPLSSPNHNKMEDAKFASELRYILFHHQTTTMALFFVQMLRCVISSFITKPQPDVHLSAGDAVALYPLSSPNHNLFDASLCLLQVALYPLSSPNHNAIFLLLSVMMVALYPLSSPNHNILAWCNFAKCVALYPLSSPNHNLYFLCVVI